MIPVPESVTTVYVGATPALRHFDQPLLQHLAKGCRVASWYYAQGLDEPACIDTAVRLLRDSLQGRSRHLVGHGLGGVIALRLAQAYPDLVQSLVLLSVGAQVFLTWHTHFYVQRHLLALSREHQMARLLRSLFGTLPNPAPSCVVQALLHDLDHSPHPHSLWQLHGAEPKGVEMPLLVCGGTCDPIVDAQALQAWQALSKSSDRLWLCPEGYHFFHYHFAKAVAQHMIHFYRSDVPAALAYSL